MNGGDVRPDYQLENLKTEVEGLTVERDYYRAQRDRWRERANVLDRQRPRLPDRPNDRLVEALKDAIDVAVWLTGLGEIPTDSAWPAMREKLNRAMGVLLDAGILLGEAEEDPA